MQFRDLKRQYAKLKPDIDAAVQKAIDRGIFIGGEYVANIERELADYVGVSECVSCANGTDALVLAMKANDISIGDAVFVPDFSYIASASTISLVGATPVFVDVNRDTFNIDCDAFEKTIKSFPKDSALKPKAVITVDLFGLPADYERIEKITKQYGLLLIEDGAQGFGGQMKSRKSCSFGDIATTSFFPAKPLGCYGDGGAIFTNDKEIADKLRLLRSNGASSADKYDNLVIGTNSRLDSLQAAILAVKLDAFQKFELNAVNKVADWYNARLDGIVKIPVVSDGYHSSWAQYTIILEDKNTRGGLQKHLADNGIPTMVYYKKTLHRQKAFEDTPRFSDNFPNSEYLSERVLSLPIHPYLTEEEVEAVCSKIKDYLGTEML
ncbi:MAG: DegT/DnrJ/EryC1/StrS family aminotransferase [Prevotellaceae bacterium]|jgi:dTDP-4-amino-4,6-dideoxygalactose transaminase|nr:DegT/DnrJ/EryC1/StrS family aminotransferase [Prevotellaceae bacterium]